MIKSVKTLIENVFAESRSPTDPVALPAEVDTLEKARSLDESLCATRKIVENTQGYGSPRYKLVNTQLEAVQQVTNHHSKLAEFARVTQQFKTDFERFEQAVKTTKSSVSQAENTLHSATEKNANLEARLAPLVEKLNAEGIQALDRLNEAQRLFDVALASGNEAAEASTAEALALAKRDSQPNALTGSPIEIRVSALKKELQNSQALSDAASIALTAAIDDAHAAESNLSKLHYDKKIFDLVCFLANHKEKFSSLRNNADLQIDTNNLEIKIHSPSRFIFLGLNFKLHINSAVSNIAAQPTKYNFGYLDILKQNINDLPELIQEKAKPEPVLSDYTNRPAVY